MIVSRLVHSPNALPSSGLEAPHEPPGTSNIQHPTPNIQRTSELSISSAFDVGCWMLDVFHWFRGSMREIFRGILSMNRRAGVPPAARRSQADLANSDGLSGGMPLRPRW